VEFEVGKEGLEMPVCTKKIIIINSGYQEFDLIKKVVFGF